MSSQVNSQAQILIADDEELIRETIAEAFSREGFIVDQAADGLQALEKIKLFPYDVLILDMRMPYATGEEVLREALLLYPELIVIMITGYADVEAAVRAIKNGAYDYIAKPFQLEEIVIRARRALEEKKLKLENRYLKGELQEKYSFDNLIGISPAMRNVFRLIKLTSRTNSTVLITGETGTGKELVARAIHYNSPRRDHLMIAINCAAIPENLLEDELFGHTKGAFTGAYQVRIGRFEQADKGTLFLDEIACMSPDLQAKLLRVLQERQFERIGGSTTIKVDVRIIAATNADLQQKVAEGKFREDLYYRLNVIHIHIPPLRERKEDITLLVNYFLDTICKEWGIPPKTMSPEALRLLMSYDWPGNVRQLKNTIEMAIVMSDSRGTITCEDLPNIFGINREDAALLPNLDVPDEGISLNTAVSEIERRLILRSLQKANWNKSKAADLLKIKRTTLVEKLKRMNLSGPVS